MKSKKSLQSISPSLPSHTKKIPFKLLAWNFQLCRQNLEIFPLLRAKRFYFKKFIDSDQDDIPLESYKFFSRSFKNSKLHKTLRCINIPNFFSPYFYENLKNAKNLQNYAFQFYKDDGDLAKLIIDLKRLPAQVKEISFFVRPEHAGEEIFKVARYARRFPKLQSFHRKYISYFWADKTHVEKELSIYSRSVARLKEMNSMKFTVNRDDIYAFKNAMRKGAAYSGITGLEINFSTLAFSHYDEMRPYLNNKSLQFDFENLTDTQQAIYSQVREDLKRDDDLIQFAETLRNEDIYLRDEDMIGQRFRAWCIMREETRLLYHFNSFPNLKELSIKISGPSFPLAPSLVDSFKSLKNLATLKVEIMRRSGGTTNFFKGFLQLPLLKSFSLTMNYLKNEDWGLLQHFISEQGKLQSLYLCQEEAPSTRDYYLQHSTYLKNITEYLQNKSCLRSLGLKFPSYSLETLSSGLSSLDLPNQLHTLELNASVHSILSQAKKRVEGLCQFIKSQKESLKKFNLNIPFAFKDEILTDIAEAVSHLTQLKELKLEYSFDFNNIIHTFTENLKERMVSKEGKEKFLLPEKWSPGLARYLQKLEKLENFIFVDGLRNKKIELTGQWLVDIFTVLPSLKNLRKLEIRDSGSYSFVGKDKTIAYALKNLKNIKSMHIDIGEISLRIDYTFLNGRWNKSEASFEERFLRSIMIFSQ